MLRPWSKAGLYLYLGDAFLAVTQLQGGWRPRVVEKVLLAFAPNEPEAALQAFEAWLMKKGGRGDRKLHLTLGQGHVPVLMLPWSRDSVRPAFRRTLAAGLLEKQLQKNSAEYEVRFGPAQFGQPQLAAFLLQLQLKAWQELAMRHQLQLQTVRPLLSAVWDSFHPMLARGSGRLVLVEESRMLTASYTDGHIQRIAVRPTDREMLETTLHVAGSERVHFFAPEHYTDALGDKSGLLALRGHDGQRLDHSYACGLCGAF